MSSATDTVCFFAKLIIAFIPPSLHLGCPCNSSLRFPQTVLKERTEGEFCFHSNKQLMGMEASTGKSSFSTDRVKLEAVTKVETGITGDFFDHIEDLMDFSNEEIGAPIGESSINYPDDAIFGGSSMTEAVSSNFRGDESDSGSLCVPCDDLAELEWLSGFPVDSLLETGPKSLYTPAFGVGLKDKYEEEKNSDKFRSSSPTSVLEQNSDKFRSPSPTSVLESNSRKLSIFSPEITVPGKARSKRPRAPVCNWGSRTLFPASSDGLLENDPNSFSSDSGYFIIRQEESEPLKKIIKTNQGGKKKGHDTTHVRKCLHCGIQKTPQWRAGPMGPKTLCNACGVRYKSGRLLPEYRPAASPTFSVVKHSNSHKKVLEMRRQRELMMQQHASQANQAFLGSGDDGLVNIGEYW